MKILPLLFFFLALSAKGFTQLLKGQFLLGGSIRFASVKESYYPDGDYKATNIFVSPAIGYFVFNKLAGGVRVDFSSYKTSSSSVETKKTTTALSPFVRYYFLPLAAKANAFLDVGYLHSKSKWSSLSRSFDGDKSNGFQILAGPSFFLTEQIALEFTVGLRHTKATDEGAIFEPSESTTVSSGLGLQIHFGKKKQPPATKDNTR